MGCDTNPVEVEGRRPSRRTAFLSIIGGGPPAEAARTAGQTVLVIEHHLDLTKVADYIIDMGPEGGKGGGNVIAAGTPEQVADTEYSHTGQFLRDIYRYWSNGL